MQALDVKLCTIANPSAHIVYVNPESLPGASGGGHILTPSLCFFEHGVQVAFYDGRTYARKWRQ
jgi:hypothetical protein